MYSSSYTPHQSTPHLSWSPWPASLIPAAHSLSSLSACPVNHLTTQSSKAKEEEEEEKINYAIVFHAGSVKPINLLKYVCHFKHVICARAAYASSMRIIRDMESGSWIFADAAFLPVSKYREWARTERYMADGGCWEARWMLADGTYKNNYLLTKTNPKNNNHCSTLHCMFKTLISSDLETNICLNLNKEHKPYLVPLNAVEIITRYICY